MRTLLRCPYGHESSFEVVHVEKGKHGAENPLGLKCNQCERVFVKEFQLITDRLDPWGPPVSAYMWSSPMYELNGSWQGEQLTIVTVED